MLRSVKYRKHSTFSRCTHRSYEPRSSIHSRTPSMSTSTQVRIPSVATEFAPIPDTELQVSRVALGTWAIGGWMWGGTDERESVATIRAALDQGINLIDTGPAYGC